MAKTKSKTKRDEDTGFEVSPGLIAGIAAGAGLALAVLWEWQRHADERRSGQVTPKRQRTIAATDRSPTPKGNPMRYTGDRKPDMAVDYVPGEDPSSLDNQDTRIDTTTVPPPLPA